MDTQQDRTFSTLSITDQDIVQFATHALAAEHDAARYDVYRELSRPDHVRVGLSSVIFELSAGVEVK
jgi:hypothetical protein